MNDILIENCLNIYRFGSIVYETNNINSDEDYIVVLKDNSIYIPDDINIQCFTKEQFIFAIYNHDIQVLECLFLSESNIIKQDIDFSKYFDLNLNNLRKSISTISSKSWVKGKKKLIISADYDKYLGIKSIFHSLRIIDFGIQIGLHGKITNYSSMNWLWFELLKLYEKYDRNELWDVISDRYKSLNNEKHSKFKILSPKENNDYSKILLKINKKYNYCMNNECFNEILELLENKNDL